MSAPAITVLAGHLRAAVLAAGLARGNQTVPVLEHLRLNAADGTLSVTGTDLQFWSTASAPCQGVPLQATVSRRTLTGLLAPLTPEDEVTLELDRKLGRVRLKAAHIQAFLMTHPVEDMPAPAELGDAFEFTIEAAALRRMLAITAHAMSEEETRYYLNGVYLHRTASEAGSVLRATATDGHRLAIAEEPCPAGAECLDGVIVPREACVALRLLLNAAATGNVTVQIDGRFARFALSTWQLHTKLIDGNFPDYRRVIPDVGNGARIRVVAPRALSRTLSALHAVSRQRALPVLLSNGDGNTLRMSVREPDGGDASSAVPDEIAAWEGGGEHPSAGFQIRYLQQVCSAIPGGFTMQVKDAVGPCRVDFPGGLALLMPMRV